MLDSGVQSGTYPLANYHRVLTHCGDTTRDVPKEPGFSTLYVFSGPRAERRITEVDDEAIHNRTLGELPISRYLVRLIDSITARRDVFRMGMPTSTGHVYYLAPRSDFRPQGSLHTSVPMLANDRRLGN